MPVPLEVTIGGSTTSIIMESGIRGPAGPAGETGPAGATGAAGPNIITLNTTETSGFTANYLVAVSSDGKTVSQFDPSTLTVASAIESNVSVTKSFTDTHLLTSVDGKVVGIARSTFDAAGAGTSAVAAHVGESDPHTPYVLADGTRAFTGNVLVGSVGAGGKAVRIFDSGGVDYGSITLVDNEYIFSKSGGGQAAIDAVVYWSNIDGKPSTFPPESHTHGNLTNAGAIGSTSGLPIITTTNGVLVAGSFGTTSGTFCAGNDSRLSDARTPTSHTHPASEISDSTSVGRSVLTAADAGAARTAIGAGTGSGTVTSVSGTGTVSGLTLTGTVTTSGNLTLGGTLSVALSSLQQGGATTGQVLEWSGSAWAPATLSGGGGGTVTSVGGTGTVSGLTLSGTVTTSGNLTLGGTLAVTASNFASQTKNTFLSAPNGSDGTPTFRAIVAADVPTLNQSTTGNAATATKLETARTINGTSFDGTTNITITADPNSHTHGNITNAGAIGSTSGQFVVTGTSGVLEASTPAAAVGTLAGSWVVESDASVALSDANHAGRRVRFTNSAATLTTSTGLTLAGDVLVLPASGGTLTVTQGSGVTLQPSSSVTVGDNGAAITWISSDTYRVFGDVS